MPETNEYARKAIEMVGADPNQLGCVMLNVELPGVYRQVLDPEMTYSSDILTYVDGLDGLPHITLLYGLLFSAKKNKGLIDGVLKGWYEPNVVLFPEVGVFQGNDGNHDYSCLVLKLGENEWDYNALAEGNGLLRKLPHVNSYPKYDPHITIGYVRKEYEQEGLNLLREIEVRPFRTAGFDYGD